MNRKVYIKPRMKQIIINENELVATSIPYAGDDNGGEGGDIPTAEVKSFNVWDIEY